MLTRGETSVNMDMVVGDVGQRKKPLLTHLYLSIYLSIYLSMEKIGLCTHKPTPLGVLTQEGMACEQNKTDIHT